MQNVQLKSNTKTFHCECCGHYTDSAVEVWIDNQLIDTLEHDDHFGGGNWNGEEENLYAFVLKELGYKLSFEDILLPTEIMPEKPLESGSYYYEFYKDETLKTIPVKVYNNRHSMERHDGKPGFYDYQSRFSFLINDKEVTLEKDSFEDLFSEVLNSLAKVEWETNDEDCSVYYDYETYDSNEDGNED